MAVSAPRSVEAPLIQLRSFDERAGWILLGLLWLGTRLIYLLNVVLGHHYPDPAFFLYGLKVSYGEVPYHDFQVEYPPLGILLIVLPGIVHAGPLTEWGYGSSFALEMLALDVLTLFLVTRLAKGLIPGDRTGLYAGLLYTAFVAASGAIAQKFDLVAGTFCVVAVVALMRRRDGLAWVMLVLATLTKGYPLALAPLFILYRMIEGRAGWRGLYEGLRAAVVSSAVLTLPLVLVAGIQPLVHAVVYHVDRGTEIESVYSGLMLLVGRLFGIATSSYANYGDQSQDILSPLNTLVDMIAVPLGLLLIGYLYWQFYRSIKSRPEEREAALLRTTVLVLLAFIITFRALPGHYLLAILPLAALVRFQGRRQTVFVLTLLAALLLGQVETVVWPQLLAVQWIGIVALNLRNTAILASFALLLGGQMQSFMPLARAWGQRVTNGLPRPSLGWAVESGIRSWYEVPTPFDSYRETATTRQAAMLAQQTHLMQQRHLIV